MSQNGVGRKINPFMTFISFYQSTEKHKYKVKYKNSSHY